MVHRVVLGVGIVLAAGALTLSVGAVLSQRMAQVDCGEMQVAGQIGGPFELTNEDGERVTDADVIDRPALVYFGYTFCPDVCPLDGARNAEAAYLLAERGLDVRPIFITVDPARDTPAVLAEFTDYFHPGMLGLTGSVADINAVTQAYKVYASVPVDPEDDYYLVGHSTHSYLVTPDGGTLDVLRRDASPEEVADRAACILGQ